jgi:hypothetical protein
MGVLGCWGQLVSEIKITCNITVSINTVNVFSLWYKYPATFLFAVHRV